MQAKKINATIAEVVEELGLGMGVGSQRAAIEDKQLVETFAIARKKAPKAFLIANLGGVQLVYGYGLREVREAIEMIDADAIAIHLNSLQESVQPEGQTKFKGLLKKIGEIAEELDKPLIIKETGSGIAAEEARKLEAAGVKGIDIGGAGGTSFSAVEYFRAEVKKGQRCVGEAFWDWGIPTVVSLVETVQTVQIPIIASGGIREGIDIAKSIGLGASLAGLSFPVLQAAVKGVKETEEMLSLLVEELRNTMFLIGAETVRDIKKASLLVMGKTAKWLRARGFEIEVYARRGEN